MSGAAMSLITAISGFLLLFTVTAVQGHNDWRVTYTPTQICALKGSTVDMHCTYMYPSSELIVKKKFWFTKESNNVYVDLKTDPQYSGRVQYQCGNNDCTLRITDLRESDSAEYKFRFTTGQRGKYTGLPGVTLTVTDLQVQVGRSAVIGYSKSADLKCESSCPLPDNLSYVWYKNDQIINGQTSNSYSHSLDPTNRISCAVEGHENSRSPSVVVKDVWDVTYTSTQICGFRNSTVEIHCTYRYPSSGYIVKTKFWFTKENNNGFVDLETDSRYSGRVQYQCGSSNCTLRITDLRKSDSAEYKFRFTTDQQSGKYTGLPGVTLTVTDPQLQVHVRRSTVNSYSNWTELTCHSNCQLPDQSSYIWYKNGDKLSANKQYFNLDTFDSTDRFSCAVKGHEGFSSPIVYAPTLPSVSVSPSAEIVEGSSVTLTCSSDASPAANYTWYKEDDHNPLSHTAQHIFSSIRPSDSGNYFCTSENDLGRRRSGSREIDVKYAPKLPSVSVSPSGEIVEGSSVILTCSSDANPAAKYTWYKEGDHKALSDMKQFNLSSIQSSESGHYYCTAKNKIGTNTSGRIFINVTYAPKLPSVSVSPSGEIVEGSSVTLTCSSDANPTKYTWYKEGEDSPKASGQNFTITDIRPEHSGSYYCVAQNSKGRQNSASRPINIASSRKSAAFASITVVFLAFIILSGIILIRRKRCFKANSSIERPDNRAEGNANDYYTLSAWPDHHGPSAAAQSTAAEQQDDDCYTTVHFFRKQEEPNYYNIIPTQPKRQNEDEEVEDVEYTHIRFSSTQRLRHHQTVEDSAAVYGTVNRK